MILDRSFAFRARIHTRLHRRLPVLLLGEMDRERRDFPVQPILFLRKRRPGVRHTRIAFVSGLPFSSLGELKTVVGVIPENVRLFHAERRGDGTPWSQCPYDIVTFGNLACHRSLASMRIFVAIILASISTAALADSTGDRKLGDRTPPSATDVISGLYAFSRFQQGLLESTDLKGNAEVKNLAALRAEEAAKRDKALKHIQETIGAEPRVSKTASASASLVEPETSDGPTYVRSFYASQIPEYEATIELLERYLKAPDNAALAAFAREQLPLLRAQVKAAERTMADK
ncbi:uncharacterized protein DUF4142 [Bradyrhizobium daqingense]|uniref:Uncharacterized protein DUF4142 n=2 Tax=Bradyrhizobium daqingense TaxID=993502 RepID=A0A562L9D3_9BRAD|nr:uncharacterized protein DUF4142 [Bradyrhizobium daqingense]